MYLILVLVVRLGIVNSPFEDEKPLDADDEDDDEDEETLGDPIQSVVWFSFFLLLTILQFASILARLSS
jgi:hypothetical protein